MKNFLIFACVAGLASAIAIYFVTDSFNNAELVEDDYYDDYNMESFGRGADVDLADSI